MSAMTTHEVMQLVIILLTVVSGIGGLYHAITKELRGKVGCDTFNSKMKEKVDSGMFLECVENIKNTLARHDTYFDRLFQAHDETVAKITRLETKIELLIKENGKKQGYT